MNVRTEPSQRAGSETLTASCPGLSAQQVALRGGKVLGGTLTLRVRLSGSRSKGELVRGCLSGKDLVSFE